MSVKHSGQNESLKESIEFAATILRTIVGLVGIWIAFAIYRLNARYLKSRPSDETPAVHSSVTFNAGIVHKVGMRTNFSKRQTLRVDFGPKS
jgi:hypothetical protein